MFHPIAFIARRKGERVMKVESKKCNALEHVPACATWPPLWMRKPEPDKTLPQVFTLQEDLQELWEERVCIMHFDGQLPWKEAEALALADILNRVKSNIQ
jgi:hypothetical protein